ncbi:Gfo/Idh/MocA family protein [Roseibium aggregatum]|uniref:Gfo/Idh/MocA family oxidoreductase n=1 Tax=Roseibium aggregatum TaxID=187304 RepID=A0A926NYZ3_9HYPH|nr:Gfo/Idh/MocA family oxidoreductase [Roseibium aggregatum]MBD1546886.1 Gfo/Idh/MocA family oxidoreductase [Roseibium aggregatum]
MNTIVSSPLQRLPVRVLLIGLGRMGQLHLKCLSGLTSVDLAGVVDTDAGRAGAANGLRFSSDPADFAGEFDAAIIAVPADNHAEVALPLLARGVNCLVEKPLALSSGEIGKMIAAARAGGAVLAVGQVERFNPQIENCTARLGRQAGDIRVERLSQGSGAPGEADVISDLMIHDLDWIIRHEGSTDCAIDLLETRGPVDRLEYVRCRLDFGPRRYDLSAGHGEDCRKRTVQISAADGVAEDYDLLDFMCGKRLDPLTRQAQAFVDACHGGETELATASDALAVYHLIERIRALGDPVLEPAERFA